MGVTERAAHRILGDLIESGYVRKERAGRRNHYLLNLDHPMRHPLERSTPVGHLIEALAGTVSIGWAPLLARGGVAHPSPRRVAKGGRVPARSED